jgi:hypothetical protein
MESNVDAWTASLEERFVPAFQVCKSLLAAFCLAACSDMPKQEARAGNGGQVARSTCEPSYVEVSNDPIVARPDPYVEVGARLALIGCANDLAAITPGQKEAIAAHLRKLLAGKHFLMRRESRSPAFRHSLAAAANEIAGRPAVTDVLVFGLYSRDLN